MTGGLSYAAFAGVVGVDRSTIYEWAKVHPEFAEAKAKGESASLLWWERQGRDGVWSVTSYDDSGKVIEKRVLNTGVWFGNMKNRFGWRDQIEQKVTSNVTVEASNGQAYLDTLKKVLDARENERKG